MYITPTRQKLDTSGWSQGVDYSDVAYWKWDRLVSEEDCNKIISVGEAIGLKQGTVRDGVQIDKSIRQCHLSWIDHTNNPWIHDIVWNAATKQPWAYDIRGFIDQLQYTVYDGDDLRQDYYTWHQDIGTNMQHRKVSFTLMLSDNDEYEGGDFEILGFDGRVIRVPKFGKGSALLFPSYARHRVTPVTKGTRKVLVAWVSGPKLK